MEEDILVALDLLSSKRPSAISPQQQAANDERPITGDQRPATGDQQPATVPQSPLSNLPRLLQRESHNLRGFQPDKAPVFFAQQLRNRARAMVLRELEQAARGWLAARGDPYLDLLWRTGAESAVLERTLVGHWDMVQAVVLTPDGKRIVSASSDDTLKIWELDSGRLLASASLDVALWCVAVGPDPEGRHQKDTRIVIGGALGNLYCLRYVEP